MRRYLLTVLEGPDIGRSWELRLGKTLIGRLGPQAHDDVETHRWVLIDKTVSRCHIQIKLQDPGVPVLEHRSSTNDTFVDGRKIEQKENLQPGQVIRLGQTAIVLEVS